MRFSSALFLITMGSLPTGDISSDAKRRRKDNQPTNVLPPRKPRKPRQLSMFLMMPVDIGSEVIMLPPSITLANTISQIYGHLHPLDLLRVARTTKLLRTSLMSRSSRFIWKKALSGVDELPGCPPDMNEPEYAYLMFDPQCNVSEASFYSRGTSNLALVLLDGA